MLKEILADQQNSSSWIMKLATKQIEQFNILWSENLISLAWNFTNLRYMYNNYYQDLLLLVIMEGYLECGRQQ